MNIRDDYELYIKKEDLLLLLEHLDYHMSRKDLIEKVKEIPTKLFAPWDDKTNRWE